MKLTYHWLRDFVEIKISPHALAAKLTMAGLEVTSLEEKEGDFIFEIEITSNRPDWLSVVGVAREVAAITGKKLKTVAGGRLQAPGKNLRQVTGQMRLQIENKKDCPLYTAKIIQGVKVGPSPEWLKKRLELIGCRSVNNIVDITNYVLFTWGEPLHAFDLDKLAAKEIVVRRARSGEKITTIDGQAKELNPQILIIADKKEAIAIAGVMGGKDTEVTLETKNILLEAAIFDPVLVRHARQRLGLQSESSYRFERGMDVKTLDCASWQAVKLIQELCGGDLTAAKSAGQTATKALKINLDLAFTRRVLGIEIGTAKAKQILQSLNFQLTQKKKDNFIVKIPAFRQDIKLEIDLIEELARIYGYEKIPDSLPAIIPQINNDKTRELISLTKNILVELGLNEVMTYSLVDKDLLAAFQIPKDAPSEILNPLSKEQEVLRPTLIPSLARCVADNLNQKQDYISLFEIAKVFNAAGGGALPQEELALGIALCGTKTLLLEQGQIKDNAGLLHLKGVFEAVFARLGIKNYRFVLPDKNGEALIYLDTEKIGGMQIIAKDILEKLEVKNKEIVIAQIDLAPAFKRANLNRRFVELPLYPGISRDLSLVLKEEIKIEDILQAVWEKGSDLLREVKVVDYYKGKQIPAGFKGLTISCLYRADTRTLTEEEVNPLHNLVSAGLKGRFDAQVR